MPAAVRNVAIILLIAAAVAFLPGGGTTADVISWLLGVVFLGALAWFAARMYREYRITLMDMEDRLRGLLYAAAAVATLAIVGTGQMWDTGIGTLLWLAMLGASIYAVVFVVRSVRRY